MCACGGDEPESVNEALRVAVHNINWSKVPPGTLSPTDRLVLTNAIYFNGHWASPFYTFDTYDANFALFSGGQVQTPTMHQTSQFSYMASGSRNRDPALER
jgi:serpin B